MTAHLGPGSQVLQASEVLREKPVLVERDSIVQPQDHDPNQLSIVTPDLLRLIQEGDAHGEAMVPSEIATVIKRRGFFASRPSAS